MTPLTLSSALWVWKLTDSFQCPRFYQSMTTALLWFQTVINTFQTHQHAPCLYFRAQHIDIFSHKPCVTSTIKTPKRSRLKNIKHPNLQIIWKSTCRFFPLLSLSLSLSYFCHWVIMSGIVDMWTSEVAKLRQKGQTLFSSGSTTAPPEPTLVVPPHEGSSSLLCPVFKYSEASVSVIVEWFSAWTRKDILSFFNNQCEYCS